jgi:trehalose 6-phosphate synthase
VGTPPDRVEKTLERVASGHAGALVERKTWSVCLHFRRVRPAAREALLVEATHAMHEWIDEHPEYEMLEALQAIEVRHRGANKGSAVEWLRGRLGEDAPLIALGDDLTDEDTFAALAPADVAIVVAPRERPTHATARLDGPEDVRAFLSWLARARSKREEGDARMPRDRQPSHVDGAPLVAVSNRLPDHSARSDDRSRNVGGLVAALEPALAARGGVWLGWSGHARESARELAIDRSALPARASFDFAPRWHQLYYNGLSNRGLWPIFHGLTGRARFDDEEWAAYVEVNDVFAAAAQRLAAEDAVIWVHDYHLLLVGDALRKRGFEGKIGFFLHIPFPPLDLFETIPWAHEIARAMLAFDVVGFHTRRYAANFVAAAGALAGAQPVEGGLTVGDPPRFVRAGAFPLGIEPGHFGEQGVDEATEEELAQLHAALGDRKLVLGVDRLDYTKGIPQRLEAFSRMLELHPEWRGKVSMVQVAVPSRADVPEYAEQRTAIETLVGHINGEHGEAHWVPVRYVYRAYGRAHLARLYRAADVAFVTPLRDGMNLVAKEFVAAQDAADPGVLLLSRFAGAAEELDAALLTNPWHRDGMARDLARALEMPLEERRQRQAALAAKVKETTSTSWACACLGALGIR